MSSMRQNYGENRLNTVYLDFTAGGKVQAETLLPKNQSLMIEVVKCLYSSLKALFILFRLTIFLARQA